MPAVPGEEEFSELVDFDPAQVDLVGRGANGIPTFLIAKQAHGTGLLDPDYIRGLVAQPQPDLKEDDTVTITGSPENVAKAMQAIHEAAVRGKEDHAADTDPLAVAKAAYEAVVKAKYNADDIKRMTASGEAMSDGSYPVADEADLDAAIHAVGRGGDEHNAIRRHIVKRAKALGKSSMIPADWAADGSVKAKVAKDALDAAVAMPDEGDLDSGVDGLDPTTPFAAPDNLDDLPGDPTDPGSPAWEGIDAATASKWLGILARAQNAIGLLSDREMLEAVTADPDDADNAYNLQDASCALDYVISALAVFAAGEQAESDLAAEAMEAVSKAVAGASAPLDVIEGLVAVRKAGRVLSAANEGKIRAAEQSLAEVLASLPQAPAADPTTPVAKEKEGAMPENARELVAKDAAASPEDQAADTGPEPVPGTTTGLGQPRVTGPAAALPADGPQQPQPGDVPGRTVIKADETGKPKMQAVYNSKGQLIGIVDPKNITEIAGADGDPDPGPDETKTDPPADPAASADPAAAADPADAADDLDPQPPADAGTPAQDVAKSGDADDEDMITIAQTVLESAVAEVVKEALEGQEAAHQQVVAKMAADKDEQAEQIRVLKERLTTVEETPAMPKVVSNGMVPPSHLMRGQDQAADGPQVDVAKAAQLRETLANGSGPEQAAAFHEMNQMAFAQFGAVRNGVTPRQQSPAVGA